MPGKRTLYPSVNRALYNAQDVMDAFLEKAIENTGMTDPERAALRTCLAAIHTCTGVVPRYKELP